MKILKSNIYFQATLFVIFSTTLALGANQALAYDDSENWARKIVNSRVIARNLQSLIQTRELIPETDIQELMQPYIVGGGPVTEFRNPFQVALLLRSIADNQDAQFCGGTVVAPNKIVTAAHCSDFVTAGQVQVLTDTRRLDGTGTRRNVLRIIIHSSWNASTFNNDVAIWEMSTSTVMAIADLAIFDGAVGNNLLVTGWGRLSEGGSTPIDLHGVEVPLVSRTNCNDVNSYNGAITTNMLCAGFDAGGRDSCQGDSGGPLTGGLTNTVLTGIVSWGFGCAQPNLFGVYTRISSPGIRQFIKTNVPSPVLSGSASTAVVTGFGTLTNVFVRTSTSSSVRRIWGTRKYANVQATANAYCAALGRGTAIRWDANTCGEDESSYIRFNPTTGNWENKSSGSANNRPDYCRYPLLSSVTCNP